jgi:hypothetical protein
MIHSFIFIDVRDHGDKTRQAKILEERILTRITFKYMLLLTEVTVCSFSRVVLEASWQSIAIHSSTRSVLYL